MTPNGTMYPPRARLFLSICCGTILGLLTVGCSSHDAKLVPVEGKVLVSGKPLTRGWVIFKPDHKKGNDSKEEPRGSIDETGTYRLMTHVKDGIAPGWYKIAVTAADQIDLKNPYFTNWLIPERYSDPIKSKLELEVVKDAPPGKYDLKLDAK